MRACAGILGRLFGHRYEARHTTVESVPPAISWREVPFCMSLTPATAMRPGSSTYHGDVCTRCGDVVNDTAAPAGSPHGVNGAPVTAASPHAHVAA